MLNPLYMDPQHAISNQCIILNSQGSISEEHPLKLVHDSNILTRSATAYTQVLDLHNAMSGVKKCINKHFPRAHRQTCRIRTRELLIQRPNLYH